MTRPTLTVVIVAALAAGTLGLTLLDHHAPAGVPSAKFPGARSTRAGSPEARRTVAVTSTTPASTTLDIAGLLPIDRAEFRTAAALAVRFTSLYGTYRYDEPPRTYLARLRSLSTAELSGQLTQAALTAGIRGQHSRDHVIATGHATIDRIQSLGPDSVIFIMSLRVTITTTATSSARDQQLAVTTIKDADGWRVNDLQPATAGDQGDAPDAPVP